MESKGYSSTSRPPPSAMKAFEKIRDKQKLKDAELRRTAFQKGEENKVTVEPEAEETNLEVEDASMESKGYSSTSRPPPSVMKAFEKIRDKQKLKDAELRRTAFQKGEENKVTVESEAEETNLEDELASLAIKNKAEKRIELQKDELQMIVEAEYEKIRAQVAEEYAKIKYADEIVYTKKRKYQFPEMSSEKFKEKSEELIKEAELRCPIPTEDLPSIEEMNSDFIGCSNNKEKLRAIIDEIETCYFQSLLHAKNMHFHICVCDINQMQKIDDEEVILPYALFDYLHSLMDHVAHLDDLQTLFANLRADSAELFSWWIPNDLLYCIVFGLNHARNRGTIRQLKGASVYIYCKHSMRHGHDVYHAPYGLPGLARFRVCPKPVFADSILKITFGATGFFDPDTQIHLVRIEGRVCNIRIW